MNQELKDIVRSAFKAVDNADLKAIFDMMADDIEQVDELTKKWSRCKADVVAAMTPFSIGEISCRIFILLNG